MRLNSYIVFSFVNTIIYSLPASWVWNDVGFLGLAYKLHTNTFPLAHRQLGFFDFAGASVVHYTGGLTSLIATVMLGHPTRRGVLTKLSYHVHTLPVHFPFFNTTPPLGPRLGRFGTADDEHNAPMSSAVTSLTGTFMLWWAWLGFNCGSTFGIRGNLWVQAATAGQLCHRPIPLVHVHI
jgi:ammonia channel protein AmtB